MFSTSFKDLLRTQSATMEGDIVQHFGTPSIELTALETNAIACPIADLIRIKATGSDRAKFLHNFCTNDINGLAVGSACEAIFTDVKARTIAHGYVLAAESSHEIWMLPGDKETLLNHLNRYIIMEDVTIEAIEPPCISFVVSGPNTHTVLAVAELGLPADAPDNSCRLVDEASILQITWNDWPTVFVSAPANSATDLWNRLLQSGATASGELVFQHLRILEGFPICGRDLTADNLAPESGRNQKTISYTKGCYLGQEPIARIDAMGHVNRQLFRCHATAAAVADESEALPAVTSISPLEADPRPALTMLKVKDADEGNELRAKTSEGGCVSLKVVTPPS